MPILVSSASSKVATEVALEAINRNALVTRAGHIAMTNAVLISAYLEISEGKDGTGTSRPQDRNFSLYNSYLRHTETLQLKISSSGCSYPGNRICYKNVYMLFVILQVRIYVFE